MENIKTLTKHLIKMYMHYPQDMIMMFEAGLAKHEPCPEEINSIAGMYADEYDFIRSVFF